MVELRNSYLKSPKIRKNAVFANFLPHHLGVHLHPIKSKLPPLKLPHISNQLL